MTTLKEFNSFEFIPLKAAQGDIVPVHREEIERHLHSYGGYRITELIRVVELAEELVNKTFIKNEDGSVSIPLVNLDIMNVYLEFISAIKNLKDLLKDHNLLELLQSSKIKDNKIYLYSEQDKVH